MSTSPFFFLYRKSEISSKCRFQFSDDEEEEVKDMDLGEEEMFACSKLPPVQLPLDYSLHTRQKSVISRAKGTVRTAVYNNIMMYIHINYPLHPQLH